MSLKPTDSAKFCFCTIITADYVAYACALYDALAELHPEVELVALVSDRTAGESSDSLLPRDGNITFIHYNALCTDGVGKAIYEKYHRINHDAFRWSMKPVLLTHLLERRQKVVYVDCDIHFYSDFAFLFGLLDEWYVLLSPHFRSIDPVADRANYIMQFNNGIYNGGFVGANKNAMEALRWWAGVCSQICEINACQGQFVDQSHLNLLPVFFDNIHILKHRGCNVANWNQIECKRVSVDGCIKINGRYPIVFVHFTKSTVRGIMEGSDMLLRPFLNTYLSRLKSYGVTLNSILPPSAKVPLYKKVNPRYMIRFLKHWFLRIRMRY